MHESTIIYSTQGHTLPPLTSGSKAPFDHNSRHLRWPRPMAPAPVCVVGTEYVKEGNDLSNPQLNDFLSEKLRLWSTIDAEFPCANSSSEYVRMPWIRPTMKS